MTALAEVVEGLAGGMRLVGGDGFDHDPNAAEQRLALPEDVGAELPLDDDLEFDEVPG
jgi:hypothetical protein